ncbi:hypothetical protein [Litoribacillus peritrichatus]|uniref:Uncharacterized protein n=1 Tax=Litoribacillus peritrichatus TaxID=718191 RepID=A0ABP7N4H1_9GAMM
MKFWKLLALSAAITGATTASANQLADKNIILVQGFQLQHVFMSRTHDDGKRFGYNYWNRFDLYNDGNGAVSVGNPTGITLMDQNIPMLKDANGDTFNIYDTSKQAVYASDSHAKILHFDSTYRLEEPNGEGIGATIAQQLDDLFDDDPTFCIRTNGCLVITHSTGDLIMQYVEENKNSLLDSATRDAFDVTAYVDLAGARGGTEGATLLYHLANFLDDLASNTVLSSEKQDEVDDANEWINFFLGTEDVEYFAPGKHFQSGVLYNLQPDQARSTGLSNPDGIPHLRVASAGDEPYGFVTHLLIKGQDDSVVPLHSSCGSSEPKSYDSCVSNRKLDGETTWLANAPSSLYDHHYPFIQSESLRHNGHQWDDSGNYMTPLMDNGNFVDDLDIDFETVIYRDLLLDKHILIENSSNKTMAQVLDASLD